MIISRTRLTGRVPFLTHTRIISTSPLVKKRKPEAVQPVTFGQGSLSGGVSRKYDSSVRDLFTKMGSQTSSSLISPSTLLGSSTVIRPSQIPSNLTSMNVQSDRAVLKKFHYLLVISCYSYACRFLRTEFIKNITQVLVLSSTDVAKPQVDRTHVLIAIKAGGLNQLWKCISEFIQEGFCTIVRFKK